MAAPPARSWTNLPVACLHEILARVPCAADRYRAYVTCTAWSKGNEVADDSSPPEQPPALPWLLLPSRDPQGYPRVVCVLSGYRVHHCPTIITPRPGMRCFGSHDGAWLFLAIREPHGHRLLNARTGDVRHLPGQVQMMVRMTPFAPFRSDMTIHAVALSSAPEEDASCVAVAIVSAGARHLRSVALWCMGWRHAREIGPPGPDQIAEELDAVDVVYHDEAFHLLRTRGDHISVCRPFLLPENRCFDEEWEDRRFHPGGRIYDQYVRDRYLVVSRGELLLVVRFTPHPGQPTSKFKVFQATKRPLTPEGGAGADDDDDTDFPVAAYPWAWSELDTLDGRILFVGYGCSRSYEVEDAQGRIQYKGFKAGIYFLDDGEFYDVAVIFGNGNGTQYPCCDNGWWSDDGHVHSCFPTSDPSGHSAPAWLLP